MLLLLLPVALATSPPVDLATLAAGRCGDLSALSELSFTFVVEAGGEEKARRRHTWTPPTSSVTVTLADGPVTLTMAPDMPTTAEDPRWAELAPGVAGARALEAWGAFVNDQFWLLAPCKVFDAGVKRTVSAPDRLQLSFEGVGLTPGDTYTLQVAPGTGRVTGWTFTLQSGREGDFAWAGHAPVGPLELSLLRTSADGGLVIRFEDAVATPSAR